MSTFYYSLSKDTNNGAWDSAKQYSYALSPSYADFLQGCKLLAHHCKCIVRACQSPGYDNQGNYIHCSCKECQLFHGS